MSPDTDESQDRTPRHAGDKKRAKPVTMTARSKRYLEAKGYFVALVERSMWIDERKFGIPTGKKFLQKWDCFGFADLAAVHPAASGTLYIQTTTRDHQAERRTKTEQQPAVKVILQAGNAIAVHGWAKKGGRGQRKLWAVSVFALRLSGTKLEWVEQGDCEVEEDGQEVEALF